MLNKLITLTFVLCISVAVNAQIESPAPSPFAKLEQIVGLTKVTLEYSRPAMRGRTIFGDLVPYGKVWRTGANYRTKITFEDDVRIDGKDLKAGSYGILSVPTEDFWDIIFYTDANGGGAPAELDESKVALKVTAKTHLLTEDVQSFSIWFSNLTESTAKVNIAWAKTHVSFDMITPSDKRAMASIKNAMSGPTADEYFQSATYLYSSGKDLKLAKEWMDKAINMFETPRFWQLRQQSLIYAALGDKEGAIEIAQKSLEDAEKSGNADYIKMNKESIAEWSK
ncbi:DUF2911 domain-containing protein [Urechidicola sp. KH5]